MYKTIMKKIYFIIILFYSSILFSNEISEIEIEGFSIGDQLINYLSQEYILEEIELNKNAYDYLSDDFGEVYIFENLKKYDTVSFFVKTDDEKYTIYAINAKYGYDDDLINCFTNQKKLAKKYSNAYPNSKKREYNIEFPIDPSGESISYNIEFLFNNGDFLEVNCAKYKKELKTQFNWQDTLQVNISKSEIYDWLTNHID